MRPGSTPPRDPSAAPSVASNSTLLQEVKRISPRAAAPPSFISRSALAVGGGLAGALCLALLHARVLPAIDAALHVGAPGVAAIGLTSAPVMAAMLWGCLRRGSSERWVSYGLGVGLCLICAFFLPVGFPERADFFVMGLPAGIVLAPLGLAFSRDRAGNLGFHLGLVLLALGSAVLYVLALPFDAEHLEFVFDLLGEGSVYAVLFFGGACLVGGQVLASRFLRYEPLYKGLVIGTALGALLAILWRSLAGLMSLPAP